MFNGLNNIVRTQSQQQQAFLQNQQDMRAAERRAISNKYDTLTFTALEQEVARELDELCQDNKCLHLNRWLNKLYLFKQEYLIYKTYD